MPRMMRYGFVMVAVMVMAVTAAYAQPSGGGTGQATPTPTGPATRPAIPGFPQEFEDFDDILENPQLAMDQFILGARSALETFVNENRPRVDANVNAFNRALELPITRVMAVVLGALALAFPLKTKVWAWLFLGAVLGYIVAQMPIGNEIRLDLFRSDMRFMMEEPQGTIGMVAGGALMGLLVLLSAFYAVASVAGAAAGVMIALQVIGGSGDAAGAAAIVGSTIGFFAIAYALSRGAALIPLAIGAAMVVFGLGVPPFFIIPLVIIGGLFAFVRSPQGRARTKREKLPSLELKDGKVDLNRSNTQGRAHLHEILPQMADDRDDPLIKR